MTLRDLAFDLFRDYGRVDLERLNARDRTDLADIYAQENPAPLQKVLDDLHYEFCRAENELLMQAHNDDYS